ncbi:hypothetical protein, partial [Leptospira interrogans]|uniref:hypothetical protein n=1 Tax=Leptospira interrogans TaxID=173 RepID=UPI001E38A6D3
DFPKGFNTFLKPILSLQNDLQHFQNLSNFFGLNLFSNYLLRGRVKIVPSYLTAQLTKKIAVFKKYRKFEMMAF